jgi:hypothetical protein
VSSIQLRRGVLDTTLCHTVRQWLAAGRWFSPSLPVSSTNKTDSHDIIEISLKVELNTITLTYQFKRKYCTIMKYITIDRRKLEMWEVEWRKFSSYEFLSMYEMFLCKIAYLKQRKHIHSLEFLDSDWTKDVTWDRCIFPYVYTNGCNYIWQSMVSDWKQDVYMILKMPYIDILC